VDKKADKGLDAGQLDISLDLLRPAKSRRQMQPRNFMNVAPLQLGEEVFWIHSRAATAPVRRRISIQP